MEPKQSVQVATDELMEEFQLTELESRLEMAVALSPGQELEELYCCECVGNPYCEPL